MLNVRIFQETLFFLLAEEPLNSIAFDVGRLMWISLSSSSSNHRLFLFYIFYEITLKINYVF